MNKSIKYSNLFGTNYSTVDPDKSDVKYKNVVCKSLLNEGFNGNNYISAKVIKDGADIKAVTDKGEVHYFEIKGTCYKHPLIQTYYSSIMKAMKNENKYWFILVRKFENKYLPLLYFNLNQWLKLFPLQGPTLKGSLRNARIITQEEINFNGAIYHTPRERRNSVIMPNKTVFLKYKNLIKKLFNK